MDPNMQPPAAPPVSQPWPPPWVQAKNQGYQPTAEEREKAQFANLFGGIADFLLGSLFIPIAVPFLVLAMTKDRGPFLMYHVNQSFWFRVAISCMQVAFFIITIITCGFLFFLMFIPPLISVVFSLIVGMAAKNGEWKEIPMIGEKVLNSSSPVLKG
jgi:uncharacterized Tic20 family protein